MSFCVLSLADLGECFSCRLLIVCGAVDADADADAVDASNADADASADYAIADYANADYASADYISVVGCRGVCVVAGTATRT